MPEELNLELIRAVTAAPFEEIRSIRYGRMTREIAKTIVFANPEDATG